MIGLGFGGTFGLIMFGKKNYEHWNVSANEIVWWKRVLTTLAILSVCGIIMLPFLLIKTDTIGNIYVTMILKSFLPTFGAGFFLLSGICEHILIKIDWLKVNHESAHNPYGGSAVDNRFNFENNDVYGGVGDSGSLVNESVHEF